MWRSSIRIYLVVLALIAAAGASFAVDSAYAQLTREPRIEGVSYSEMAEWQGRYGGGPMPGYLHPGISPQVYGCSPPPPCGWAPPARNPKKKVRSRRR